MVVASVDRLIGDVYEAALIPERWPSVLRQLSDISAGAFASLVIIVNHTIKFVGTPEAQQLIADYVALGKPGFNPRIAGRTAIREQGYFADHDMFSQAQIEADRSIAIFCGLAAMAGLPPIAFGRRLERSPVAGA